MELGRARGRAGYRERDRCLRVTDVGRGHGSGAHPREHTSLVMPCPSTPESHFLLHFLSHCLTIFAPPGKITSLVSPRDRTLSQRIEWALQHGEPLDQLSADPNILPPSQVGLGGRVWGKCGA